MTKVINLSQYKEKQMNKAYIKYYGNTEVEVHKVTRRPHLVVAMKAEDISEYINAVEKDLQEEGIDINELNIIKPNPNIPW